MEPLTNFIVGLLSGVLIVCMLTVPIVIYLLLKEK